MNFTFQEIPPFGFGHFLQFGTSEDREHSRRLEALVAENRNDPDQSRAETKTDAERIAPVPGTRNDYHFHVR